MRRSFSFAAVMALVSTDKTFAEPLLSPALERPTVTDTLMTLPSTSSVVDLFTNPPLDYIGFSAGGARLSVRPIGGHAPGDSIRTQLMVETLSGGDASAEESSVIFDMAGVTGYAPPWAAGKSWTAKRQITGSDGAIFTNILACTAGKGPAPASNSNAYSSFTKEQSDGGCTWQYVGIGAGDTRSAALLTTNIYAPGQGPFGPIPGSVGGGQGWGEAIIAGVKPGAWPEGGGHLVGLEIDEGNETHDCPPGVCDLYGIFLNGNGTYRSTIGAFIGGTQGFHIGIQFSGNSASDTTIADASGSQTGYLDSGSHMIASRRDLSTSRTSESFEGSYTSSVLLDVSNASITDRFAYVHTAHSFAGFYDDASANGFRSGGTHTGASFLDQSTAQYGLRLLGKYGQSSISTPGFSVSPSGEVDARSYISDGSIGVSCSATPSIHFTTMNGIVTHC